MILSLYALINLNVINWGTREAVAKATGQEPESQLQALLSKIPFLKVPTTAFPIPSDWSSTQRLAQIGEKRKPDAEKAEERVICSPCCPQNAQAARSLFLSPD